MFLRYIIFIFFIDCRTLGSIRSKAAGYKKACQEWSKKTKMSAKEFTNCVKNPLITGSDDIKVIDVFPVMELHIYTGSFNRLYDLGDEILKESQSSFDMGLWAESQTLH